MSLPCPIESNATPQPSNTSTHDRYEVIITDAQCQPTAVLERRKPLKGETVAFKCKAKTYLTIWPSDVKPLGVVVDIKYSKDIVIPIPIETPASYAVTLTKPYGRIEAGDTVYIDLTAPIEGDTVIYRTSGGGYAITRWPADVVPVGVFAGFVHKLQPGDADRWKQEAQECRQ